MALSSISASSVSQGKVSASIDAISSLNWIDRVEVRSAWFKSLDSLPGVLVNILGFVAKVTFGSHFTHWYAVLHGAHDSHAVVQFGGNKIECSLGPYKKICQDVDDVYSGSSWVIRDKKAVISDWKSVKCFCDKYGKTYGEYHFVSNSCQHFAERLFDFLTKEQAPVKRRRQENIDLPNVRHDDGGEHAHPKRRRVDLPIMLGKVMLKKHDGMDCGRYLTAHAKYCDGKRDDGSSWALVHNSGGDAMWEVVEVDRERRLVMLKKHDGMDCGRYLTAHAEHCDGKRDGGSSWALVHDIGLDMWEVEWVDRQGRLVKLKKRDGMGCGCYLTAHAEYCDGKRDGGSSWALVHDSGGDATWEFEGYDHP